MTLQPCPFCGGAPKLSEHNRVTCARCQAMGPYPGEPEQWNSRQGYVPRLSDDDVCELEALRAFREAVVDVAVKRQKGYAERRHGDVLNKECMDEVVGFCKLDSQTRISGGQG